jgi:hypothetical protein
VLLARDPFFGHTYWEISRVRIDRAIAELGGEARGVLALIDAEDDRTLKTGEVWAERGRYVFRLPAGDRGYRAELALEAPNGKKITLERSNTVLAPPSLPREGAEPYFVELDPQRAVLERSGDLENPPALAADHHARPEAPRAAAPEHAGEPPPPLFSTTVESEKPAITSGGSEPRLSR